MNEMVERVARAFLAAVSSGGGDAYVESHAVDLTNVMIDGQIDIAAGMAAAIAALREPTDAMRNAASFDREDPDPMGDIWRAMIDAALRDV